MNKIEEVKQEVRHREWAEQVRECQSSGLSIRERKLLISLEIIGKIWYNKSTGKADK